MKNLHFFTDNVATLASVIGSLTVVGSALIWVYNQMIAKPIEKKRLEAEKKRNEMMVKVILKENKPLNESIKQLTEWLSESKSDREAIHVNLDQHEKMINEHEKRIDEHSKRLTVLETKTETLNHDKRW